MNSYEVLLQKIERLQKVISDSINSHEVLIQKVERLEKVISILAPDSIPSEVELEKHNDLNGDLYLNDDFTDISNSMYTFEDVETLKSINTFIDDAISYDINYVYKQRENKCSPFSIFKKMIYTIQTEFEFTKLKLMGDFFNITEEDADALSIVDSIALNSKNIFLTNVDQYIDWYNENKSQFEKFGEDCPYTVLLEFVESTKEEIHKHLENGTKVQKFRNGLDFMFEDNEYSRISRNGMSFTLDYIEGFIDDAIIYDISYVYKQRENKRSLFSVFKDSASWLQFNFKGFIAQLKYSFNERGDTIIADNLVWSTEANGVTYHSSYPNKFKQYIDWYNENKAEFEKFGEDCPYTIMLGFIESTRDLILSYFPELETLNSISEIKQIKENLPTKKKIVYDFSASEWGVIIHYASDVEDKGTIKSYIESFIQKHNIAQTVSNITNSYYQEKQKINTNSKHSIKKLEAILPFIREYYKKAETKVKNDIKIIKEENKNN